MLSKVVIYNPYSNTTVTEHYIQVVERALNECGVNTEYVCRLKKATDKKTGAFVISPEDVIPVKMKGYSPVIVWCQGIVPEESFMRHHSRIRKMVLSAFEVLGLKAADMILYISRAMEEHYTRKYHFVSDDAYIMPCFDTDIQRESFFTEGKYNNNVFLYAGGLQVWQCFEETVKLYKKIEMQVNNAHFRVLTKEREVAKEILERYKVHSYSIDYVEHTQINREMRNAKFGFAIRKDDPVNRVATPTKLSTYVANGMIPIYSKVIESFESVAGKSRYCIGLDENEHGAIEHIMKLCTIDINADDVLGEFTEAFGECFSSDYHCKHLKSFFSKRLN